MMNEKISIMIFKNVIIKKLSQSVILLLSMLTLISGCGKFDHSKIKMPEFSFVTTENLHSISFYDSGHIWISGNYGTILFSSDGGASWEKQESGVNVLLGNICFVNQEMGWAAGVKGTIIHTSDGGKTWHQQQSGTENDLLDLFFLNHHQGWAVGEFGTIIHTENGGKSWTHQTEEQDTLYNDVFFIDNLTGWVVGEFGTILHTKDGGRTWQSQYCKEIVPEVDESGWERPLPALYGIWFLDMNRGWIVGMDGAIIRTADGGKVWKKVDSGTDKPFYSIVIIGQKGWIVGNKGVYLTSHDGGYFWAIKDDTLKTKFWLREVSFTDDKHGLIVGARGTIVRSDDGGSTWDIISGYRYDMEEFGLADF